MLENNLKPCTILRLKAIDAKMGVDKDLVELYKKDPNTFLLDLGLEPDEIALIKPISRGPPKNPECFNEVITGNLVVSGRSNPGKSGYPCECCTMFSGSCGSGCANVSGTPKGYSAGS